MNPKHFIPSLRLTEVACTAVAVAQPQIASKVVPRVRAGLGRVLGSLAVVGALHLGFPAGVQAQESLRDIVQTQGAAWMIGHWTGTNSQGQAVEVEYEWELEGHAIEVEVAMGDTGYKGLIFRSPPDGEVVEAGVDSQGGMTRATWRVEEGKVLSERTGTRPGGQVIRVAVVNTRVDADTVKATIHTLSADGEVGEAALDTVRLTRTKEAQEED